MSNLVSDTVGVRHQDSAGHPVTTPGRERPRRLRRTKTLRNLVAETAVGPQHLIMPHFVVPERRANQPIAAMPGIAQMGL